MKHFLEKLQKNQKKDHFLVYCCTFFTMGAMLNGIGPLIPYMSEAFNVPQISYSILFPGRTFGYLVGTLLVKSLIKNFKFHNLMIWSVLIFSGSSIGFNYSIQIVYQILYIGINAVALAFYDIILNSSLLIFNKDKDKAFWIQTAHGIFGIGSLSSPLIAYFFQLNTFLCFGLINLLTIFGYYHLDSPEEKRQQIEKELTEFIIIDTQNQFPNNQIQNQKRSNNLEKQKKFVTQTSLQNEYKKNKNIEYKLKPITRQMLIYLSLLYFVYSGLQTSYSIWIPTYSVLSKISNKQQATVYSMVFYLSMTISRFILAIPNTSKISERSKFSFKLLLVISILAIILHFSYPHFGCYLISILYGFAMSPLYSWYLAISHQYHFQLRASDYSSILITSMFGPTFFPMLIGYMFEISLSMLFVGVFIMGLLQYFFLMKLENQYEKNSQINQYYKQKKVQGQNQQNK